MRLKQNEVIQITEYVQSIIKGQKGELRLYGSRADDSLKGGDIDLVLILPNSEEKNKFHVPIHEIIAALKTKIGDRKIDFKIISQSETQKPFWSLALKRSVSLFNN